MYLSLPSIIPFFSVQSSGNNTAKMEEIANSVTFCDVRRGGEEAGDLKGSCWANHGLSCVDHEY